MQRLSVLESISLMMLQITSPAGQLLSAITSVPLATSCFDRVQAFLLNPSQDDTREILDAALSSGRGTSHTARSYGGNPEAVELQEMPNRLLPHSTVNAVSLESVNVRLASEAALAIQDVTFTVPHGCLTMIVGPVGCGKSTLIKAILGELPPERGQISLASSSAAYAAQRPWLQNGTVRDAVTGVQYYSIDEIWYRDVLHACALDQDIQQMEDGEHTRISGRGNALSGGQKQRLVRSPYVETPACVLTSARLWQELFMHGKVSQSWMTLSVPWMLPQMQP